MRIIALDAYGSDLGPAAMAEGALEALELDPELKILFFGDEQELSGILAGKEHERLTIVHAPDKITNDDSPTLSVRRKLQSSLVMAMKAVKDGQACGVVSAGSTGAILAGGIFRVGRIRGVHRPALCPVLPQVDGSRALLIDSGANVDCKPEYLMQFPQAEVHRQQDHASGAVALRERTYHVYAYRLGQPLYACAGYV